MKKLIKVIKNDDELIKNERRGFFQEGEDKWGRKYEKKWDDNGIYTKKEELKDGTMKYTIKDHRNKK